MPSVRLNRVAETIREILGELIEFEIKDPRIGMVTVTSLDLTPDLKYAKVYLSMLADDEKKQETLKVLNAASGFMRTELGKRIRLKSIPALEFFEDKSIEEGRKIDELISEIEKKRGEPSE